MNTNRQHEVRFPSAEAFKPLSRRAQVAITWTSAAASGIAVALTAALVLDWSLLGCIAAVLVGAPPVSVTLATLVARILTAKER